MALQNVEGKFDDHLHWPLHCTLSLQLLDKLGKHHLERSVKLQIPRGGSSNMSAKKKNPGKWCSILERTIESLDFRVDLK